MNDNRRHLLDANVPSAGSSLKTVPRYAFLSESEKGQAKGDIIRNRSSEQTDVAIQAFLICANSSRLSVRPS